MTVAVWLLLAVATLALGQNIEPTGPRGHVLTPEQTTGITIRVFSNDGTPAQDAAVSFIAPEAGPTVRFADAPWASPFLLRTRTDAQGLARVEVTANDRPGPFLIDALVESSLKTTTFAVTNTFDNVPPPLDAEAATRAVVERFSITSSNTLRGPLLLEAGTSVKPAGPGQSTYRVDRRTWLFWIDENPGAGYEHDLQYVYVDATNPNPRPETWRISSERWWPSITLPNNGGTSSLLSPVTANRTAGHLSSITPTTLPAAGAPAGPAVIVKEPGACAIVVAGANERAVLLSRQEMETFFLQDKGIPADRVLTTRDADGNPVATTPDQLNALIAEARRKGCTRLYLYLMSHGASGNITLKNPQEDATNPLIAVRYSDIADQLVSFSNVSVIVDACQSGSAIAPLHNAGVNGTVVTATDSKSFGVYYSMYYGSFFTHYLLQGWRGGNDVNGDGQVDEKEAAAYASGQILSSNFASFIAWKSSGNLGPSQISDLDGTGGLLGAGDVRIFLDDPSTNPGSVVIPLPANAVGKWDWNAEVGSPQIATLPTGSTDTGSLQGRGQARLFFTGVTPGSTTYTFTAHDEQRKSYGVEGRILVGRSYIAAQTQIVLNVGQTYTLQLYRPPQLASSGPLRLTASSPDADGGAVATVGDDIFGIGDSATSVQITANRGGNAKYSFTDPSGNAVEVNVQVNGFWATPNPVRVRAGQDAGMLIFRSGATGPLRIRAKSNFDREIAGVSSEASAEVVFPPNSDTTGIIVTGRTAGTALYDIEDEKGNKYEVRIIVESAGTFAASPPVFTEVGDAVEADVGVRNANGQLVPWQLIDVSYTGLEAVQFYDPAVETRPNVRRQAARSATVVPPGGKVTVRMNEQGFLRMLYLAGPAGRATVRFEAPAFGAVEYPVVINPRRATAPDSIQVTPPATVRAGVEASIQVVARREGQPAGPVSVTFQITGGTFSTGSRFASNTISQVTTNSAGTATATFQPAAPGAVIIRIFTGPVTQDVRLTATN